MEDIQSWWELPSIAHFCSLFRAAFDLLDFDIEELEEALLTDGLDDLGSPLLVELMVRLVQGCLPGKTINATNQQSYLRKLFKHKSNEDPTRDNLYTEGDFRWMPLRQKVEILHALCDFRLEADDVLDLLKNLESDSLRVEPLGYDDSGSTYWYFYGTRLYREDHSLYHPHRRKPKEKDKDDKRKKKRKKKGHEESDDCEPEEQRSSWQVNVGLRKAGFQPIAPSVFQVQCFLEEDWNNLADKFECCQSKLERSLLQTLREDFLPEIPKLFHEKEKIQRRRMLEFAPRRSSGRVQRIKEKKEEEEQKHAIESVEKVKKKQEDEDKRRRREEREQEMLLEEKDRKKGREVLKEEIIQEKVSPAKVFMCQNKQNKDLDDEEEIESEEEIVQEVIEIDDLEEVEISDDEAEFDFKRNEENERIEERKPKEKRAKDYREEVEGEMDEDKIRKEKEGKKRRGRKPKSINHSHRTEEERMYNEDDDFDEDDDNGAPQVYSGRKTNNSLSSIAFSSLTSGTEESADVAVSDSNTVTSPPNKKKVKSSQLVLQTEEDLRTGMYKVLEHLRDHPDAWPFHDPVEEEYAPNYYAVIRRPMHISRMEERLDGGYYTTLPLFELDFKLMMDNCKLYNGPESDYTHMAYTLEKAFAKLKTKYLEVDLSSDDEMYIDMSYQSQSTKRKHKRRNNSDEKENEEQRPKKKRGRKPKNRESGDSDAGLIKEKKKPGRPPKERTMSDDSVFENSEEVKVRKKPGRKPKVPRENEDHIDGVVKVRKKPGRKPKNLTISDNLEREIPISNENVFSDEHASDQGSVKVRKKPGRKPKYQTIPDDVKSDIPNNDEYIFKDENASETPVIKEKKKRGRKPKEHKILENSHELTDFIAKERPGRPAKEKVYYADDSYDELDYVDDEDIADEDIADEETQNDIEVVTKEKKKRGRKPKEKKNIEDLFGDIVKDKVKKKPGRKPKDSNNEISFNGEDTRSKKKPKAEKTIDLYEFRDEYDDEDNDDDDDDDNFEEPPLLVREDPYPEEEDEEEDEIQEVTPVKKPRGRPRKEDSPKKSPIKSPIKVVEEKDDNDLIDEDVDDDDDSDDGVDNDVCLLYYKNDEDEELEEEDEEIENKNDKENEFEDTKGKIVIEEVEKVQPVKKSRGRGRPRKEESPKKCSVKKIVSKEVIEDKEEVNKENIVETQDEELQVVELQDVELQEVELQEVEPQDIEPQDDIIEEELEPDFEVEPEEVVQSEKVDKEERKARDVYLSEKHAELFGEIDDISHDEEEYEKTKKKIHEKKHNHINKKRKSNGSKDKEDKPKKKHKHGEKHHNKHHHHHHHHHKSKFKEGKHHKKKGKHSIEKDEKRILKVEDVFDYSEEDDTKGISDGHHAVEEELDDEEGVETKKSSSKLKTKEESKEGKKKKRRNRGKHSKHHDKLDKHKDGKNKESKKNGKKKSSKKKKIPLKDLAAIDALSAATEHALKDITTMLDDPNVPKFSEYSPECNSPSRKVTSEEFEAIALKIESEYRKKLKLEENSKDIKKKKRSRKNGDDGGTEEMEPKKKKIKKEKDKVKSEPVDKEISSETKEVMKDIKDGRIKPGAIIKSKDIAKKEGVVKKEAKAPMDAKAKAAKNPFGKINKQEHSKLTTLIAKAKESRIGLVPNSEVGDSPKLSLGSIIRSGDIGTGVKSSREPNSDGEEEKWESRDKWDSPWEKTEKEDTPPVKIEEEKEEEREEVVEIIEKEEEPPPPTPRAPEIKQERATPNLSAWFKAFGTPKIPAGQKKPEEPEPILSPPTQKEDEEDELIDVDNRPEDVDVKDDEQLQSPVAEVDNIDVLDEPPPSMLPPVSPQPPPVSPEPPISPEKPPETPWYDKIDEKLEEEPIWKKLKHEEDEDPYKFEEEELDRAREVAKKLEVERQRKASVSSSGMSDGKSPLNHSFDSDRSPAAFSSGGESPITKSPMTPGFGSKQFSPVPEKSPSIPAFSPRYETLSKPFPGYDPDKAKYQANGAIKVGFYQDMTDKVADKSDKKGLDSQKNPVESPPVYSPTVPYVSNFYSNKATAETPSLKKQQKSPAASYTSTFYTSESGSDKANKTPSYYSVPSAPTTPNTDKPSPASLTPGGSHGSLTPGSHGSLTPTALTPDSLTHGALTPTSLNPGGLTPTNLTPTSLTPSAHTPAASISQSSLTSPVSLTTEIDKNKPPYSYYSYDPNKPLTDQYAKNSSSASPKGAANKPPSYYSSHDKTSGQSPVSTQISPSLPSQSSNSLASPSQIPIAAAVPMPQEKQDMQPPKKRMAMEQQLMQEFNSSASSVVGQSGVRGNPLGAPNVTVPFASPAGGSFQQNLANLSQIVSRISDTEKDSQKLSQTSNDTRNMVYGNLQNKQPSLYGNSNSQSSTSTQNMGLDRSALTDLASTSGRTSAADLRQLELEQRSLPPNYNQQITSPHMQTAPSLTSPSLTSPSLTSPSLTSPGLGSPQLSKNSQQVHSQPPAAHQNTRDSSRPPSRDLPPEKAYLQQKSMWQSSFTSSLVSSIANSMMTNSIISSLALGGKGMASITSVSPSSDRNSQDRLAALSAADRTSQDRYAQDRLAQDRLAQDRYAQERLIQERFATQLGILARGNQQANQFAHDLIMRGSAAGATASQGQSSGSSSGGNTSSTSASSGSTTATSRVSNNNANNSASGTSSSTNSATNNSSSSQEMLARSYANMMTTGQSSPLFGRGDGSLTPSSLPRPLSGSSSPFLPQSPGLSAALGLPGAPRTPTPAHQQSNQSLSSLRQESLGTINPRDPISQSHPSLQIPSLNSISTSQALNAASLASYSGRDSLSLMNQGRREAAALTSSPGAMDVQLYQQYIQRQQQLAQEELLRLHPTQLAAHQSMMLQQGLMPYSSGYPPSLGLRPGSYQGMNRPWL